MERTSADPPLVVLIDTALPDEQARRIAALSPRIELVRGLDRAGLARAHVVYTGDAAFDPAAAPALRWVQIDTAAVNHLRDKPIARAGVPIANVRGAYSVAVAEFALGLVLTLTRRLHACADLQRQRRWPRHPEEYPALQGFNCYGTTLGVVGYGNIGRHLGRIAHAMGMRVLACKLLPRERRDAGYALPGTGDPEGSFPEAWFGVEQLRDMLPRCEVLVVTLPLTDATRGLIGAAELGLLPRGAVLVNIGRGGVVDEPALAAALRDGRLGGAGLDVLSNEPLEPDSPLWDAPNLVMTPHIASFTREQQHLAADVLIENLRRDLDGRPLINVVDMRRGY